ncbi:hypothetical protein WG66_007950 [Moniliophthora roreri]|nr:hypothetical protein WG66_007950 [Moniliophthora roreri]
MRHSVLSARVPRVPASRFGEKRRKEENSIASSGQNEDTTSAPFPPSLDTSKIRRNGLQNDELRETLPLRTRYDWQT